MTDPHAPVEGWYDDPEMALRLRWWTGERWSNHTRPKPVVEHPVEQFTSGQPLSGQTSSGDAPAVTTGSTVIAEPQAATPYGYSAPASFTPGSAPQPLGTYGARAHRPEDLWNTAASSIEYAPERTTTPAAWALAFTPLVTAIAQSAAVLLSGYESTPAIWIIGATIVPILWIIVFVRRDRLTLHEWGHLRRAHWGWAFLGALGYLVARTIVVRKQAAGRGWWPLVTNLVITAVLVNIGLFTPVLGVIRTTIF